MSNTQRQALIGVSIAAVVLVFFAVAFVLSNRDQQNTAPLATTSTSTSTPPTAPASTTVPPAGPCVAATADQIQQIEKGLTNGATKIGEAFTRTEGLTVYVGANIYDGAGKRISSADNWLIVNGQVYALSGSARSYSALADGRKLPGSPSAGDPTSQALQQCSTDAGRAK